MKSSKHFRLAVVCLLLGGSGLALLLQQGQSRVRAAQPVPFAQTPAPSGSSPRSWKSQAAAPNSPVATITVNSLADGTPTNDGQCTLREALTNANSDSQSGSTDCAAGSGADTITFSVTGTINLTGVLPDITQNLTITGPGANLLTVRRDTGGLYRLFTINSGVTATLSGLTITNGDVGSGDTGGGLRNRGTLTVQDCVVTGNHANGGGGIENSGTLTLTGSTISGNSANFNGGGLFTLDSATANLSNCTISGNQAGSSGGGFGAGVYHLSVTGSGSLQFTNCTISGNTSATAVSSGVTLTTQTSGGTVAATLRNTIIANNSAPNLITRVVGGGGAATITSLGNNLTSDNGSGFLTGVGDLINTNPQLGPLGNYGGSTPTHVLLVGSPAINAGNNTGAPVTDQRGVSRPQGSTVDIGAFELIANPLVVTNTNDAGAGSLRQAITDANLSAGADTINFNLPAGPQTINLASALPDITDSVNLANSTGANNLTVRRDTGGDYRIFNITGGVVQITQLTVTNGNLPSGQNGGGVRNLATLTLSDCVITGNSANSNAGGGVVSGGSLTINNCLISGNTAYAGGGIFARGSLTMSNSTVSGNTAVFQSGGLNLQNATATLANVTVSGNSAGTYGSGIVNIGFEGFSGSLTMTNCTVANNQSSGTAAAIDTTDGDNTSSVVTKLRNTLVANNANLSLLRGGVNATVTSEGFNLASDGGGGFLTQPTDLLNANPLLGPLADNGGPTPTLPLLLGSPALDKGSLAVGVTTDQRGLPRPFNIGSIPPASGGNDSDIGAFEAQTLPLPGLFINDVTVAEGNAGTSTATFNVTLSAASAQTVTVQYATANGTATAGSDYVSVSGTLTFNPGETSKPINVTLNGDTTPEPGETFFVNLTNPTNALLGDAQGVGTMQNDDPFPFTVTNANDAGAGSLRQALLDANANVGADAIVFEPVFFSTARTINLASALPNITGSLTITGPGANLLTVRRDTGGLYRLFTINSGVTATLSGLTITNGDVGSGATGGGLLNNGTLTMQDCVITGNHANGVGGLENRSLLTMIGCTISGNAANFSGGGLANVGNATAMLTNCTISGNTGTSANGISNTASNGQTALLTLTNCTVTANTGGSEAIRNGIASGVASVTTQLRNTLMAGNGGKNYASQGSTTLTSLGNNLDSDGSSGFTNGVSGDLVGTSASKINALLAPLGNYGGATPTHALLPGSPAINAGTSNSAPVNDQRGVARPQGAAVDIGAVESSLLVVTNTNDAGAGSLRQALTDANANADLNDIGFSLPAGPQTINLASALPNITTSVNLVNATGANNLTVRRDTGGNYRIFRIPNSGTSVTLSGLTIANGVATAAGNGGIGGGISATAQLTVNDCVITGNQASTGGGVSAAFGGVLTINRTTISNNTASQAAGVYVQDRNAVIQDSTISGNVGADTGGIRNSAGSANATMTLTNTTVSGNTSTTTDSAIRSESFSGFVSTINLTNCTVTNNSTSSAGQAGALWLRPDTGTHAVTLKNTIVSGNTSGGAFSDVTGNVEPGSSFNLIGVGGGLTNGVQGNLVGINNPQLAPLGNYGGSTQTHLLLTGSPALNAGTAAGAPATDQRGYPRPVGNAVDIGAVENEVSLTITPNTLPNGLLGVPYSQQLAQTGGATGTLAWTVTSGSLPPNVTLNAASGLLAGAPTGSGTFNFTVTVASQNGLAGVKAYTLVVGTCPTITVAPASLPASSSFTAYSQQLSASGGSAPYSLAVSAGALPAGLSLSSGGLLAGVPMVAGTFSFTVRATDANLCTGERAYTLTLSANSGLMFYPLATPVRLLDTRPGASPNACSQPNQPIPGGTSRTQPGRNICNIPANAQALTGNVTTVQSGGGFLTLYPSDAQQPTVASTNYGVNEIINNVFTVGLGADGAFKIFANATTDVVVDVTGYYAPPGAGGLYFHPLPAPVRLLETRPGLPVGCIKPGVPLTGGQDSLQTATTACTGIPAAARSVVGNATTVSPAGTGYLTLYPGDVANAPVVASSNYNAGVVVNGPFTVGLSNAGQFKIFTTQTTHLVVDVLGYYSTEANDANGAGLLFNPLPKPVRLLETRPNLPVGCFKPGVPLTGNTETTQTARGVCDGVTIPANALSVVGNATVVLPQGQGYLTLWPSTAGQPTVATSNYNVGDVGNRHFIVGLGNVDGAFKIYTQATSHLVIDLSGYFAP